MIDQFEESPTNIKMILPDLKLVNAQSYYRYAGSLTVFWFFKVTINFIIHFHPFYFFVYCHPVPKMLNGVCLNQK
jgi:hypothetical protein